MKTITCLVFAGLITFICRADGAESLKSFDGYRLDYEIDYPAVKKVSSVVVLIHGSGPQDMRGDLTAVSAPGTKNYFFKDLSDALTEKGFAVVRYNKRAYQLAEQLKKDPAFAKSSTFSDFFAHPIDTTIKDAEAFVAFSAKTFPGAKVYLLGHSEGTWISLQVADRGESVSGVALIGFATQTQDTLLFEQVVYRSLHYFESLDNDRDGVLTATELAANDPIAKSLAGQLPVLDQDKNGKLERPEFMGGNLLNILADAPGMEEWRREEAALKRPAALIKAATFNVSFFQGELDNQTPAYNVRAVQLANTLIWKKPNLHFKFFPGLGHALDKRTDYHDLVFKPADKRALGDLVSELFSRWK